METDRRGDDAEAAKPASPAAPGTTEPGSTVPDGERPRSAAPATSESDARQEPSGRPSVRVLLLRALPACLLAWAVPGLGHAVLRRFGRGLLFGLIVLSLFVGGLALDGKVYEPVEGEPLSVLAAVGAAGAGVPFAVAHLGEFAAGDLESPYHDYGNTFTLVAGLLNLLVVLDAYDVAVGRR